MNTSELDKYKVDHLFLLIGENPLPNYVAAKTLLKKGGKPYLIFTEHTDKPAERLQEALDLSDEEMVTLDNNESNSYEIKNKIREKVQELQDKYPEKKRFGLNYTGGTKAMAVHAYQALLQPRLKEPTDKLNPEPIFSYLDSRQLRMLIDQTTNPVPLDIPKELLDLSLSKLFKLHGFTLSKAPKTEVTLGNLVGAIVNHNAEWQNWCSKVLRLEARKKIELGEVKLANNEIEKIVELNNWINATELRRLALPIQDLPEEINNVMKQNNLVDINECLSIQQIEQTGIIPKPKETKKYPQEICKWLEGVWLEDYVLQQLEKIKTECSINEIGMSFDFKKEYNVAEFEFDVAFLRGYQLFAISCTTDTKPGLGKFKLFEAHRRAKQIGGDEARVALVCFCCSGNTKKIQKDFLAQVNDPKVRVFGVADIATLSEILKDWIQEVDA
ncbi:Card1-like endonuclease domain-containing protein [Coleofasciculus sp.]|uniref:Card1-like endonuclease domain-containing protein n=1 Tax=Coleofasciculus sp. TaxID=3100458 RepID=UPI003A22877B